MKPFFLLLLLIASGILFATLARPLALLVEAALKPGRSLKLIKPLRQKPSVTFPATAPGDNRRKPSLPGKRWKPATQF